MLKFQLQVACQGCELKTYMAQSTFYDKWTLFQVDLPVADIVNVTYDVEGTQRSEDHTSYKYLALDDIVVKPGVCPTYGKKCFTKLNIYYTDNMKRRDTACSLLSTE